MIDSQLQNQKFFCFWDGSWSLQQPWPECYRKLFTTFTWILKMMHLVNLLQLCFLKSFFTVAINLFDHWVCFTQKWILFKLLLFVWQYRACFKENSLLHIFSKIFWTTFSTPKKFKFNSQNFWWPFFSHRPQIMVFMHSKFTNDLFYTFYTWLYTLHTSRPNCTWVLFLHGSSLQKQPFITAHFRSSLHIVCIAAH